jgi:hypothetical protein
MPTPQRRRRDREPVREVSSTAPGGLAAADETPGRVASFDREPTHDEIARRAYQLFEKRGAAHGQDRDDWLQAERELQQETS